ncbi:hypothetical protein CHS0354_007361, partial [Potamilus streckersoni]
IKIRTLCSEVPAGLRMDSAHLRNKYLGAVLSPRRYGVYKLVDMSNGIPVRFFYVKVDDTFSLVVFELNAISQPKIDYGWRPV